jgi:hypothetical protein
MAAFKRRAVLLAISMACFGLAECGLAIPDIKEVWDADKPADANTPRIPGTAQIEFEVKKHVYCELVSAVKYVNRFPVSSGPTPANLKPFAKYPIPLDWVAQISLSFQVDESSSLNPGITLNTILPNDIHTFSPGNTVTTPQGRTLGLGATLSSTATRIDKFDPTYSVGFLMKRDTKNSVCIKENDPFLKVGWKPDTSSPFIVDGNLGIQDWLFGAILTDLFIASDTAVSGGSLKPDAVSYEIKFVIVSSANVTPTWKLVRIMPTRRERSSPRAGRERTT